MDDFRAGGWVDGCLGGGGGFHRALEVLRLIAEAEGFHERFGLGFWISGFLGGNLEKREGLRIRAGFLGEPRCLQGGTRRDIGRGGDLRKGLVGLEGGLVFSTTELESPKRHGRIFQIGIVDRLLEHGAIPLLGGILAFHGIKPTGGKIGGGESNARLLGLTSGQLELDRRGLVEFLGEEDFA